MEDKENVLQGPSCNKEIGNEQVQSVPRQSEQRGEMCQRVIFMVSNFDF